MCLKPFLDQHSFSALSFEFPFLHTLILPMNINKLQLSCTQLLIQLLFSLRYNHRKDLGGSKWNFPCLPCCTFRMPQLRNTCRYIPLRTLEIDYHATFDQVYQAVTPDGIGLLPLENQLDGFVLATLQRLQVADIDEIGEVTVPVNFGLAGKVSSLAEIKRSTCNSKLRAVSKLLTIT